MELVRGQVMLLLRDPCVQAVSCGSAGGTSAPSIHPFIHPCIPLPAAPLHSPLGLEKYPVCFPFQLVCSVTQMPDALYENKTQAAASNFGCVHTPEVRKSEVSLLSVPLTARIQDLTACKLLKIRFR